MVYSQAEHGHRRSSLLGAHRIEDHQRVGSVTRLAERDEQLAALTSLLSDAGTGDGRLVFVGGEAGAGKTALVDAFCSASAARVTALWGSCEPLSAPRPLGPLVDVAKRLGGNVADRLDEGDRDGAFDATLAALDAGADTHLLVFEDVHWADEATLDLLEFLGRRIGSVRAMVVATFRDDAIPQAHQLRSVLGDLATATAVRRLAVTPLSQAAVHALAEGTAIDPVALHRETAGNAFFVTQVLANGSREVPATVTDAVLARVGRLSGQARAALEAAAAVGLRSESSVLLSIPAVDGSGLDECITAGLLEFDSPHYVFRHELVRQSVHDATPVGCRSALHAAVLAQLRALPFASDRLARLAEHAEHAGDAAAVAELAPAAARAASGLQAHREAAAQYGRALRFAEALAPAERAELLEQRAAECYLIDLLSESITARTEAVAIRATLGQPLRVGDNMRRLSRTCWIAGHRADAEEWARRALDTLEPLPPGPELAMAYANEAALRMYRWEMPDAVAWGEKAIDLAEQVGDPTAMANALNTVGTARMLMGDQEGASFLLSSLKVALDAGLEDDAPRAWVNLAAGYSQHLEPAKAAAYLTDGLDYCLAHDLYSAGLCIQAGLCEIQFRRGLWDEARQLAKSLLENRVLARSSRLEPLFVLALLRARHGEREAWPLLDEALELAIPAGAEQWLPLVAAARAEAWWLDRKPDRIAAEVREAYEIALANDDHWSIGHLAVWLQRVGELADIPSGALEPFALQLDGKYADASAVWTKHGYPYEAAMALVDSSDESDLRNAFTMLETLGTRTDFVMRRLRELGSTVVPRGPRVSTRRNLAQLTNREMDVLKLVAQGLRDAEIADELVLSTRTVAHHVSSILAKLAVSSRREAAAKAAEHLIHAP
jgi:DNA-binding CsgD family transcriptional regulator